MNPVIYIMGVSGCGKTTVGELVSAQTGIPFFDGDDFHSEQNKNKMNSGIPLTDEDRAGWLTALNTLARTEARKKGAIIACSALKENYRKRLEEGITAACYWIFLQGDFDLIYKRMRERKGHFMPLELLQSQFDTLEIPIHALTEDIKIPPQEIADDIIKKTRLQKPGA